MKFRFEENCFPCLGHLEDLAIGERIKCEGIVQDLAEEEYIGKQLKKNLKTCLDFLNKFEKETNRKHNYYVKLNKPGRRYMILERIS